MKRFRKVGKYDRIKKSIYNKRPSIIIPSLFKLEGIYKFFSIENGIKRAIDVKHNTIMNPCINQVAKAFIGYSLVDNYSIKWLAIGDDDTAITGNETTLVNEVFRTQYISRVNPSNGVVLGDFYITDSEYSGDIEEVGIFGGDGAISTEDSGGLVSRVLWSYTKSSSEEILIEYQLTIT